MTQQRMAGDNEFQSKMKQAASGPGGQEHKTKPATLFGADAYDRQVDVNRSRSITLLSLGHEMQRIFKRMQKLVKRLLKVTATSVSTLPTSM